MYIEMQAWCFLCDPAYLQLLYCTWGVSLSYPVSWEGEERLSVAKKRNSNQFKQELGAASCNPGQCVRLLQSSRNRAVNQSSGLVSPQ